MENKSHVPNHQPDQLWSAIKSHYAKFKEAAENTVMFPTDFGNPCPQAVRKGLRKYPFEYAKAVIQYLQQAQISFDSGPQEGIFLGPNFHQLFRPRPPVISVIFTHQAFASFVPGLFAFAKFFIFLFSLILLPSRPV